LSLAPSARGGFDEISSQISSTTSPAGCARKIAVIVISAAS